jgi:4-amino-4-deoxy-L-arabinose transferase-like glycosyltransferase
VAPGTERRLLRVALVGGVGIRLLLLVSGGTGTDRFLFPDSAGYRNVAAHLPGALIDPGAAVVSDSLARTPGYPTFLVVTGGRWWIWAALVAQCVLGGAANVWLAHRLARRVGGPAVAGLAALAVAFDPASILHSLLVATETLTTTALLATLVLLIEAWDRLAHDRALAATIAAGATLGIGALVRPTLALGVPIAAAALAVAGRSRRALAAAAAIVVVAAVPIGSWAVRNDRVGGAPVLTTVTGQDLADFGLAASAAEDGRLGWRLPDRIRTSAILEAQARRDGVEGPIDGDATSVATDRRWRADGRRLLAHHPRGAAMVAVGALARTLGAPGHTGFEPHLPAWLWPIVRVPLAVVGVVWAVALTATATAGVLRALRDRRWLLLVAVALPTALYLGGSLGPWMYLRFRVPVTPLLAILAASAIVGGRADPDRRRAAPTAVAPAEPTGSARPT